MRLLITDIGFLYPVVYHIITLTFRHYKVMSDLPAEVLAAEADGTQFLLFLGALSHSAISRDTAFTLMRPAPCFVPALLAHVLEAVIIIEAAINVLMHIHVPLEFPVFWFTIMSHEGRRRTQDIAELVQSNTPTSNRFG